MDGFQSRRFHEEDPASNTVTRAVRKPMEVFKERKELDSLRCSAFPTQCKKSLEKSDSKPPALSCPRRHSLHSVKLFSWCNTVDGASRPPKADERSSIKKRGKREAETEREATDKCSSLNR